MTLAEKLKNARAAKHLSQRALAEATGLSLRTIQNYELGARLPKQREIYALLAKALDVEARILLDDTTDFVLRANEQYGSRGARQAWDLVADFRGLCAGGEVPESDIDAIMQALQDAYWDAKKLNRKYTNKRYLTDDAGEDP